MGLLWAECEVGWGVSSVPAAAAPGPLSWKIPVCPQSTARVKPSDFLAFWAGPEAVYLGVRK